MMKTMRRRCRGRPYKWGLLCTSPVPGVVARGRYPWELVDLLKRAESANWLAAGVAVGGNGGGILMRLLLLMMMMMIYR